jgi:hypothetical protein
MGNMQPLEYKNIGSEEHLTFDSIRRLVLNELSDLSEREARKHIEECFRCKGIYDSLATPSEIRKGYSYKKNTLTLIGGVVTVILLIGLAGSFLYFGGSSKGMKEKRAESGYLPNIVEEAKKSEIRQEIAPVMEAIDTLSQISDEPEVETPVAPNKLFDNYIEAEQAQPRIKLRGIYGKITGNGKPLPGVTVMIPGSSTAKITDPGGKYYIQVPQNTRSLVFIYQGRQLVKRLDPNSRRLDIYLRTEEMSFPEPGSSETESADAKVDSF